MKKILLLGVAALAFIACNSNAPVQPTVKVQLQPEGGVFNLSNGVSIVVPQGAVSSATEVTVEYMDNLDESVGNLPSDIQGRLRLTPEGLTFNKPLEVSMPLNQPVAEQQTDIVWWSASDKTWYITDRGQVEGNKVKFYIEHFSDYASIGGGWGDLFKLMDAAVGAASTPEAISSALNNFLANTMWRDMGLEDFRWPTRAKMGGGAVSTCAQTCGIFAAWESQEGDNDRQGRALYKEQSTHNIITNIALSNAQMSAHLRSEYQTAADRIIEIYGEPCATELTGEASPAKIEKGKTATVTITATCDGSPLADQLIQLSYSPELSCNVVNQKTDDNGQITITVKGKEEGDGIVYAKAVNAINSDLVTEIQIPVTVGNGEKWRITLDVTDTYSSSFGESYRTWLETLLYEDGEQTLSFSYQIVLDITIDENTVHGTMAVNNNRSAYRYSPTNFSQQGSWTDVDGSQSFWSSSQTIQASPIFNDLKDIPICGQVGSYGGIQKVIVYWGKTMDDYSNISSQGTTEDYMKDMFFAPNLSRTWESLTNIKGESSSDSGSDTYAGFASVTALSLLANLTETEQEFSESYDMNYFTTMDVEFNMLQLGDSQYLRFHNSMFLSVGMYPSNPAEWTGNRHGVRTGTLKIENLSKAE